MTRAAATGLVLFTVNLIAYAIWREWVSAVGAVFGLIATGVWSR